MTVQELNDNFVFFLLTSFPPGLKKEQGLWAYEPSICLSIGAHYERDSNYQGIPAIRFGLDFGDARKDEKLQCFCLDPPHDCPRKGICKGIVSSIFH